MSLRAGSDGSCCSSGDSAEAPVRAPPPPPPRLKRALSEEAERPSSSSSSAAGQEGLSPLDLICFHADLRCCMNLFLFKTKATQILVFASLSRGWRPAGDAQSRVPGRGQQTVVVPEETVQSSC